MVFTKEYWEKRRKKKEEEKQRKAIEERERTQRTEELNGHLSKISVDGVEIPMNMEKETPKATPAGVPEQKAPATLSLKMSLAELQIDQMAHMMVIEETYKSLAKLELPAHIANSEAERLVGPHRSRLNEITAILEQFNE